MSSNESETEESDNEEMQKANPQTQSDTDADVGLKSLLEDPAKDKKVRVIALLRLFDMKQFIIMRILNFIAVDES